MKSQIIILTLFSFILFSCDLENDSGIFLPSELSSQQLTELYSNPDSDSNNNFETVSADELGRTIYLPVIDIYVARGTVGDDNPHGTDVSEESIREMLFGWGLNSINPILLQMDIALLSQNVTIHNVRLIPNRTINDPEREDNGKRYFSWIDFANDSFRGFGGNYGLDPMILSESDINGVLTGRKLNLDPVALHVLFLEWGPTGGYTGGARSGIVNDVSGATRNVIAHEFGHMFSLGHVPNTEDFRLMNPTIYNWDMFLSDNEKQIVSNYIQSDYINPNDRLRENMRQRMKSTTKETGSLSKANINSAEALLNVVHPRGPKYIPYTNANKTLTEM